MKARIVPIVLLAGCAGGLFAQVPAGGEFQVNAHSIGIQQLPVVASDTTGNFVVVWTSVEQDGSSDGLFAQRYAASGAPVGGEFQVNSFTTDFQGDASVASDGRGGFIVTWTSAPPSTATAIAPPQDGSDCGIFAQRYDASGSPRGGEFQVNSYTTDCQWGSAVASDPAGRFIVAWTGAGVDNPDIFAQRFDASGLPSGSEFQVNSYTTDVQWYPSVASDAAGNFVVAWDSFGQDAAYTFGAFAQRYDAAGAPVGSELRLNANATSDQRCPSIAFDGAGRLVAAWQDGGDGSGWGIFGRRFDASGAPLGGDFQVNTYTTASQWLPSVAPDAAGNFVVAWTSTDQDGSLEGVIGRRFDASGAPRGPEFQLNSYTTASQRRATASMDATGNFVVVWQSMGQDGSDTGIFAQRVGGLLPAALAVDSSASSGSDGNRVLEPGETAVAVAPSWRNVNGAAQTFAGTAQSFTGPPASGVGYSLTDVAAGYGTVPNGATAPCSDCYQLGVTFGGTRPATHWDTTLTERLTPDALGQTKPWVLHLGESFDDVAKTSPFYRFVETLLHKSVTGGCGAGTYCPTSSSTREQMAVFVLVAKEGAGHLPAPCSPPNVFLDVPETSPFCRFIEELSNRGVVSGCGGGNYCPGDPVTREQMAVFVLRTLDPTLTPPPCSPPNIFNDVPETNPFCAWIEELSNRGVVSGCGGGNYCPTDPVSREQMAVFIGVTFGLSLYGP